MRLFPKEPEITLYETSFPGGTSEHRLETAKTLSRLVTDTDDPIVIALDGAWGAGKTVFLKYWTAYHLENNDNAEVVYFDAFANDFLDDPLFALTGEIKERLERDDKETEEDQAQRRDSRLKAAKKLGWAAVRVAANVATFGANEKIDGEGIGDEIAKAIGKQVEDAAKGAQDAVEDLWDKHRARKSAMEELKAALRLLTEDEDGNPAQRLIVVVDELDRCRPDYALSVLEILKHLFAVDGVHFVLGTNLSGLENAVRSRYGGQVDASTYLQRFYTLSVVLSNEWSDFRRETDYETVFADWMLEMGLSRHPYAHIAQGFIRELADDPALNFRGMQLFLRKVAVLPWTDRQHHHGLAVGITYLSVFHPSTYTAMRFSPLPWKAINETLKPRAKPDDDPCARFDDFQRASVGWFMCYSEEIPQDIISNHPNKEDSGWDTFTPETTRWVLRNLVEQVSFS